MNQRLSWKELEGWLNLPLSKFSCIERGTGLYVNCDSLEELQLVLMQSPTIRNNLESLKNIELYHGSGITTIDANATENLKRHLHKPRRARKYSNLILYIDKHGGVVIKGKNISLNVDEALAVYKAWIEKNNELSGSTNPTGHEPRGDVGAVPGGHELHAEISRDQGSQVQGS